VKVSGIRAKLLLAFVTVLVVITGLNVGLAVYLTTRQSEREAFASLTRQTVLLQNELQETAVALRAIAEKNVAEAANLNDLATIYAQTQPLTTYPELAAKYERGLLFNKIISLNRLQVILQTAGFSSAAVYMDNELSHYVTTAEAGMSTIRVGYKTLIKTGQNQAGDLEFDNWPNWAEGAPSPLITSHITPVDRPTISFDFTAEQMVVLQIVIPVQAITQTVVRNVVTEGYSEGILVNDLSIATPDTLRQSTPGRNKPAIIGAFVFKKVFDQAFLEEIAEKTGLLPALYSPDGIHQVQIVDMKMDPADLAQWAQEDQTAIDRQMQHRTLEVGQESYYQALALWKFEEEPQLIVGFAQSAASTAQKVRETVTGLVGIAGLVLLVGGTLGYLLLNRLVKPIRVFTAAVSRIGLSVQQESPDRPVTPLASDKLVEINLRASDEVGQLTTAFNAMIRQLRQSFETLEQRVAERTHELKIARDEAEVARKKAEVANQAKSVFLANMSHELRTPLNAILGYAQILQRRPLDPDVISGLNTVERSGEHLLTLINDILDISRIETGKMKLSPAPFHFPNFLEHIASIVRARAEANGLSFRSERQDTLPSWVEADETRLRQVLLDLLDNAVKFTNEGQVTLRVKQMDKWANGQMSESADLQILRFEVEDTGIGIPPDQVKRIFQPFEQLGDLAHRAKGTGLGLAISRQLVRLMGGDIHVQSEPGRGSTFWFEVALPVTEGTVEAAPPPDRLITGYQGPRRTVLVVDDVLSNRTVLIDLLGPLGFDVVAAADGQQAIHLAGEIRPDLILMDRWMPVLDGFEAAQQMRKNPELQRASIIAISASVSKEDQAQSRAAGIDDFLPKPIHWPRLAALLEKHLGLEWEYEEELEVQRVRGEKGEAAGLVPPPQKEITILYDLARRGDMRGLQERAAHIETLGEPYLPFARKLRDLVRGFEERQILTLIERYVEEEP
jgi:signal transduction histidine kinase/DNA-binding NarL/FixJ family response regulator